MEKRYQVFVSSTYEDLKAERQEVMSALLELDCIPSGMELFPAANEDQWSLIKGLIEDCDYYILILAGRYGSCDLDGIGFTEKEYRHALDCSKPVLAFIHSDPGKITSDNCESAPEGKARLTAFREFVKQKLCKTWSTPGDLGGVVSRSLVQQIKRTPAIGWVRSDELLGPEAIRELMALRQKVDQLHDELAKTRHTPPPGTEHLAQGDDAHDINYEYYIWGQHNEGSTQSSTYQTTWNEIFAALGPQMLSEIPDYLLHKGLDRFVADRQLDRLKRENPTATSIGGVHVREQDFFTRNTPSMSIGDAHVREQDFLTIWIQLRTLGLIASIIKDNRVSWTLTGHGQDVMTNLRAIRRSPSIDGGPPLDSIKSTISQ